jgi:hypothetical protein
MPDPVQLEDYITSLRSSLMRAMAEGADKELQFKAEEITLELAISATNKAGGEGGVDFKVFGVGFEAGASGETSSTNTQKLTLKLTPVKKDGSGPVLISEDVVLE